MTRTTSCLPPLRAGLLLAMLAVSSHAWATTPADEKLPEAPAPQSSSSSQSADTPQTTATQNASAQSSNGQTSNGQTNRILGIIPNFRAATTNEKLPPQSVKEKFVTASEDSFDYSAVVFPAVIALYGYETNKTPEFGKGGVAYGRYLWHSAVDQTVENYMVEFVVPALTHEDTRFYTMGHGGFVKRTEYALSRVVVTRKDNGDRTFNSGEVVGAAVAAGISNAYYPASSRTAGSTMEQWGLNVGIDAGVFTFKEFWPDISYHLLHQGPRPGTTP